MNKSITRPIVPPDNIADATCHDFFDWSECTIQGDQGEYQIFGSLNTIEKSLDKSTLVKKRDTLDRLLSNRPSLSELVEQGIMLDVAKVSPAHANEYRRLEWTQASDKLQIKIQQRPDRNSLVEQNILDDENPLVSPLLIERQKALKKCQLADRLNSALFSRPATLDLVKNGILPSSDPYAQNLINDTMFASACRRQRAAENGPKKTNVEDLGVGGSSVSNQQVVKFGNLVFHNFVPPSKNNRSKAASNHTNQQVAHAAAADSFNDDVFAADEAAPLLKSEVEQGKYSVSCGNTNFRSQLLMSELTEEIRQNGNHGGSGFAHAAHKPHQSIVNNRPAVPKTTYKCGQPPLLLPNGPLPVQQPATRPMITALERLTVTQLKAECRELGLRYNGLNKRDLQRLLHLHRSGTAAATVADSLSSSSSSVANQATAPVPAAAPLTQMEASSTLAPLVLHQPAQLSLTADQLQALLQQFHLQQLQQQEQQGQARLEHIRHLRQRLHEADQQVRNFLPTLSAHYSSACHSSSNTSSAALQQHFQELARCADKLRDQLSSACEQEQQSLQVEFHTALAQSNTQLVTLLQRRHAQLLMLLQAEEPSLQEPQQQQQSIPTIVIVRERSLTMPNSDSFRIDDDDVSANESVGQRSMSEPCSELVSTKQSDSTTIDQINANANETLNLINEILAGTEPQVDSSHELKRPASSPMHVDTATLVPMETADRTMPNHFLFPEDLREILRPILSSGADMLWNGIGAQTSSACMSGNSVTVDLLTPRTQEVMFSDLSNVMMMDADNDSVFVESV